MWTKPKQTAMHNKMDDEAKRVAKRLGAECVYIVAHFIDDKDPTALHGMSGGQLPMPESEFYRRQLMLYSQVETEETIPPEGELN
jgi:hypothetical protein